MCSWKHLYSSLRKCYKFWIKSKSPFSDKIQIWVRLLRHIVLCIRWMNSCFGNFKNHALDPVASVTHWPLLLLLLLPLPSSPSPSHSHLWKRQPIDHSSLRKRKHFSDHHVRGKCKPHLLEDPSVRSCVDCMKVNIMMWGNRYLLSQCNCKIKVIWTLNWEAAVSLMRDSVLHHYYRAKWYESCHNMLYVVLASCQNMLFWPWRAYLINQ